MTGKIRSFPNEAHMARVRDARRALGLWIAPGFVFEAPCIGESVRPIETKERSK